MVYERYSNPFSDSFKNSRKARGLEATLVDQQLTRIETLDDGDDRAFDVAVAGPAALLVAKFHKIAERVGQQPC